MFPYHRHKVTRTIQMDCQSLVKQMVFNCFCIRFKPPLLRSELSKDWFGSYVSEYSFAQSIEDGATVPIFYEKSVPRVEQVNEDLVGDAVHILEENLSEEQSQAAREGMSEEELEIY